MISTIIAAVVASGGFADFIAAIPQGWWIAIGTFLGGLALKGWEKFLNRDDSRRAEAKDFRTTIKELNADIDAAEANEAAWRKQALAGEEEVARLKTFIVAQGLTVPPKDP